jgi:glycosyltransferase involved in cell wall biosynthesis
MKICFWGNAAKSLAGSTDGGGELQIALLAKVLAKAGNEVVVVDYNITKDFVTPDGIKVLSITGWDKGIRYLRTFTHRYPNLYKTLKNQKADIYYCRIREFRHIIPYWAARKTRAKFIIGMASDLDASNFRMRAKYHYFSSIEGAYWLFNSILSELIFPFLVKNADCVFVQHEGQRSRLQQKHIQSVLFPNLIELEKTIDDTIAIKKEEFVYVGSIDKRKGILEFYEIVRETPHLRYKVIGKPRDKTGEIYFEKLKAEKNVTLLGKLDHHDTLREIASSRALISTSSMEGFPNTFIEAWANGVAVFSLFVDPGGIIERAGLGYVAKGNIPELIACMSESVKPNNGIAYVNDHHAINPSKINEVDQLFRRIVQP